VAEYLGHSDPGLTLLTYTHLMPNSQGRARRAIDAAFGASGADAGAGEADALT
jgi:integrase